MNCRSELCMVAVVMALVAEDGGTIWCTTVMYVINLHDTLALVHRPRANILCGLLCERWAMIFWQGRESYSRRQSPCTPLQSRLHTPDYRFCRATVTQFVIGCLVCSFRHPSSAMQAGKAGNDCRRHPHHCFLGVRSVQHPSYCT